MPTNLETVFRAPPLKAQVIGSLELTSFLQQMVLRSHQILGSRRAVSTLLMFWRSCYVALTLNLWASASQAAENYRAQPLT